MNTKLVILFILFLSVNIVSSETYTTKGVSNTQITSSTYTTHGVSDTSTSSSSSSSGGSGIISNEPISNVACSNTSLKDWKYNHTTNYSFNCGNVYEIIINPQENDSDIMFKLETLKNSSNKTTRLSNAYNYINIYSGSKRFNNSVIRFKLPLNWSSVTLMKWNNSWIPLITTQMSSDLSYKYYEAKTDSFSSFAITGNITPLESISSSASVTPITPAIVTTTLPFTIISEANQISEHSISNVTIITIISIAIIILLLFLIYIRRKSLIEYIKRKFL